MDARAPLATAGAAPAGIRRLWLGDALGPRPPGGPGPPALAVERRCRRLGCPLVCALAAAAGSSGAVFIVNDAVYGFVLHLILRRAQRRGLELLVAQLLLAPDRGPTPGEEADASPDAWVLYGPERPGPPAFVFPPPAPGDNLGKDLLWGRKLGAAAHRVHRLSARLYYLSSVGGGWAAVRRADMCLVFAARQYRVAKRLGDESTLANCRLYLGYHQLWTGDAGAAACIFQHEWEWARDHHRPALVRAVECAMGRLKVVVAAAGTHPQPAESFDVPAFCDRLCRCPRGAPVLDAATESDTESETGSESEPHGDPAPPAATIPPDLLPITEVWAATLSAHPGPPPGPSGP